MAATDLSLVPTTGQDGVALGSASGVITGLSSAEAEQRLSAHGPNEIRRERRTSALTLFARQFASPVIWLLLGASVLSIALGEVLDAVAITEPHNGLERAASLPSDNLAGPLPVTTLLFELCATRPGYPVELRAPVGSRTRRI